MRNKTTHIMINTMLTLPPLLALIWAITSKTITATIAMMPRETQPRIWLLIFLKYSAVNMWNTSSCRILRLRFVWYHLLRWFGIYLHCQLPDRKSASGRNLYKSRVSRLLFNQKRQLFMKRTALSDGFLVFKGKYPCYYFTTLIVYLLCVIFVVILCFR